MNIGLFGGSFDPVHNGHIAIALKAIGELSLDKLYVLPAAVSPFKTSALPSFSDTERLEFLRLVFSGNEKVVVDDRELRKGGVSFAIDTVTEFANEFKGSKIYFIIGQDSVEGLPRWKEYTRLIELCTFKAYPRTVESSTEIRRRLSLGLDIADLVPKCVMLKILGDCPH